ncbi:alpha/beta hydrolase [Streptomyces sp. AV19]|uniref:alpha/beta hydrolase n=1 Tax=Streptomyces sp. AV19 TaxID=2793068 RepID=UPI0018FE8C13|nr:alpha/beta hydrolase [Streptomyces sp. AV19]MBH1936440.1 alpha/beta hydrolase [Streptomyces sp. AV19]MDG4532491.1 alpha/beta hydrolase [Streptomyces sp. AV19]
MHLVRTTAWTAATAIGAGTAALAAGRYAGTAALRTGPGTPLPGEHPLTVHATDAGTVTLARTPSSVRPGTHGIAAPGLHAIVGPPVADVSHPHDRVVRHLVRVVHGDLRAGARVHFTPQVHAGDPHGALGIVHRDVDLPGEDGTLPAWFVPGARDTCVVAVHGLGTTREHPMVVLPFLHRSRLPVLVPALRGDPGAPRPADGIGRLGAAERYDVAAAVAEAVRRGARRVVLLGWSTGATAALLAAADPHVAPRVGGLVLDSPVLDWDAALHALAGRRTPAALRPLAVHSARARAGLDQGELRAAADPARLTVPTLLVHAPDDPVAPWHHSRDLAARRPDLVTLRTVRDAGHSALWNVDPAGYEEALRRFLTPFM